MVSHWPYCSLYAIGNEQTMAACAWMEQPALCIISGKFFGSRFYQSNVIITAQFGGPAHAIGHSVCVSLLA